MKPSAILINTARGGLIDDSALVQTLKNGGLSGAGLDCVEDESGDATKELRKMPNVVITPHVGGTTGDLGSTIIPMLVENIVRLHMGEPALYVVNRQSIR